MDKIIASLDHNVSHFPLIPDMNIPESYASVIKVFQAQCRDLTFLKFPKNREVGNADFPIS